MNAEAQQKMNPLLKLVLEIGPLAVFFLTFQFGKDIIGNATAFGWLEMATGAEALRGHSGPVFVATAAFMVAIAVSLCVSWVVGRTLPKMAVVTSSESTKPAKQVNKLPTNTDVRFKNGNGRQVLPAQE